MTTLALSSTFSEGLVRYGVQAQHLKLPQSDFLGPCFRIGGRLAVVADYRGKNQQSLQEITYRAGVVVADAGRPAHRNLISSREIVRAVSSSSLQKPRLAVIRATNRREARTPSSTFPLSYMHGYCFGIAVFEHIEAEQFNPNVALEVGYMQALRKPVCLLKDRTLRTLQIDLVAKLYCPFDPRSASASISAELGRWLRDKGLSAEAARQLPR